MPVGSGKANGDASAHRAIIAVSHAAAAVIA